MIYFSNLRPKLTHLAVCSVLFTCMPLKGICSGYYVQVGSYRVLNNAQRSLNQIEHGSHEKGRIVEIIYKNQTYYNVRFGDYQEFQTAREAQKNLENYVKSSFIRKNGRSAQAEPISHPVSKISRRSKRQVYDVARVNPIPISQVPSHRTLFSYPAFPYNPRALGDGALSTRTSFFNGDVLLPIIGNNDAIGYIDGGGKYGSDKAWFGSLGGGVRAVMDNRLWGGYFLVDYNNSIDNKGFAIANPGLELFAHNWDAHLNGYISMNGNSKNLGVFRGDEIGRPHSFYFERHTLHEFLFDISDHTGPGLDGEIGYTLPFFNVRPFIGGYHFNMNNSPNINGVEGGVELPLGSNFTLRIHDAYDKVQQNAFLGTLRLTFGALPPSRTDVRSRMLDPLRRNLGSYQTGNGVPIVKTTRQLSRTHDTGNIWFFDPNGTLFDFSAGFGNCTYEHPCSQFDQVAIDGINGLASNSLFFMETGTYNNPMVGSGLSLYSGQNIFGRMNQFRDPALGDYRPIINDSLLLPGTNTLRNIHVNATLTNSLTAALEINPGASGNINIINSLITADATNPTINISGILSSDNAATISLSGTDVLTRLTNAPTRNNNAINLQSSGPFTMTGGSSSAYGDNTNNISGVTIQSGTAKFKNATIIANSNLDNTSISAALIANAGSDVTAIGTRFNAIGTNNTNVAGSIVGIYANSGGVILLNSSINVDATNNQNNGAFGFYGQNTYSSFIGSQINVDSTNAVSNNTGNVAGIFGEGSGQLNVFNTDINSSGTNTTTNGVFGIDSNMPIYLDASSAINVLVSSTLNNSAIGIQSFTSLIYGNSSISIQTNTNSGSTVQIRGGSLVNLGNMTCTTIINGVTTTGPCIG